MRAPLIFACGFLLKCFILIIGFWTDSFYEKKLFPKAVTLWIEKGTPSRRIAKDLFEKGLIPCAHGFLAWQKVLKSPLKAGEYVFIGSLSSHDILMTLSEGHVLQRHLTLPEGITRQEIIRVLEKNPFLMGPLPLDFQEGEILPETYDYTRGEMRQDVLNRMKKAQQDYIKAFNLPSDHPLKSWDKIIILASIVEKETGIISEMPHIAGVFLHRLRMGMPLQSDPTVLYGLNIQGREPSRAELKQDHNYNTYTRPGLPQGPICNPGKAAIHAVLFPYATKDLYFVANGKGGHVFSENLADHQKNHLKWRQMRPKAILEK